MRVLFDTNILIAGFLTDGLCWKLLLKANKKEFHLFTSPYILAEFRDKLSHKFGFSLHEVEEATELIVEIAQVVDHIEKGIRVKGVCKDKKDDAIIACAIASGVDYLVTGDTDILALNRYKGIKIISARDLLNLLQKTNKNS